MAHTFLYQPRRLCSAARNCRRVLSVCLLDVLCITTHAAQLTECDHMLLYLTSQTWTRGAESDALGAELTRALDLGVHVLLARALAASRRERHTVIRAAAADHHC